MPNKILRLHTSGSNAQAGWSATGPIGRKEADEILDPQANQATNVAVSIPSPFARLHLVVGALDYVSKHPTDTQSAYHQLVSHFWDLWEVIFNHHQHRLARQPLTVRPWKRADELPRLAANPATQPLAQVLALYWDNGHFAGFPEMALLRWPLPDGTSQLLGGTSPLTLFFPAPDVRPLLRPDGTKVNRSNGVGAYFDAQYVALDTREFTFRQYVYHLFAFELALAGGSLAPAVLAVLDNAQLAALKMGIPADLTALYPTLTDYRGNPVYVGSWPVRIRPDVSIVHDSDFFIRASRPQGDKKRPIVLRPGLKAPGKKYLNETLWDETTVVPTADAADLPDRVLPGVSFQHPYLTTGDFLEDTLLAVPYEVDDTRFHTGQVTYQPGTNRKQGVLLPIKRQYFEYFEPHELREHLKIDFEPGCVRVKLSIPVQTGLPIVYEQAYYEEARDDNPYQPTIKRLRNTNISLAIFPFVKAKNAPQYNDFYKVMLVDANRENALINKEVELAFYVDNQQILLDGAARSVAVYRRTNKAEDNASIYYEIQRTHFDLIEVSSPEPATGRGLVVPNWPVKPMGTKLFRFAVDFGTTNTHVAWHDHPTGDPQPFRFGPNAGRDDTAVVLLKKPGADHNQTRYGQLFQGIELDIRPNAPIGIPGLSTYVEREFIPPYVGGGDSPFAFPIRTATYEAAGFRSQAGQIPAPAVLGAVNIGFGINSEIGVKPHYETNLKWQNTLDLPTRLRVQAFFRELLLLFRASVLLNEGDVAATQLIWFAPLSFREHDRDQYQEDWDRLFREVFHVTTKTTYIPESAAPYYFLRKTGRVALGVNDDAAFIDIGGGTTDVLLLRNKQPDLSTSFRFAGNDLWGDGAATVSGTAKDNGLVRFGLDALGSAHWPAYVDAAVKNPAFKSEDIASILFAHEKEVQFADRLRRAEHLRVLFYLHFGAIIYHIGQLVKLRELKIPAVLSFTGRGSLFLNFLVAGGNNQPLTALALDILRHVTKQEKPAQFEIVMADDPKQATANGGVLAGANAKEWTADGASREELVRHPVGTGANNPEEWQPLRPNQLTEQLKSAVLDNVRRCLDLLLTDPTMRKHQERLGVRNPTSDVRQLLEQFLVRSFNLVTDQYAENPDKQQVIPETLFFLPLKQALYELSKALHDAAGASPTPAHQ